MKRLQQKGFVLPILVITTLIISIMVVSIASLSLTDFRLARRETNRINALIAADAAIDVALVELTADETWTGTAGEITLLDEPNIRTTYEASVTDVDANTKTVIATGNTYEPASATTPTSTRKFRAEVTAATTGSSSPYSVVVGIDRLVLSDRAKITGGDVITNGWLTLGGHSQIGTETNPVNVRVADQRCPQPADATYPQICPAGGDEPITMSAASRIYGEVHANNQIDPMPTNMLDPGFIVGQSVTPTGFPHYDRTSHPVSVERNPTDSDIACPPFANTTWPANVKINGDIFLGRRCTLTIQGNVWLTGSLVTADDVTIQVDDSVGAVHPVVMVDGSLGFRLFDGSEIVGNNQETGLEVRTFWSHSSSGCSPDCVNLTGEGLFNSTNIATIVLGDNGADPVDAYNSRFVAEWSRVNVNEGSIIGSAAGQSLYINDDSVINFSTSLPGSNNLSRTWVKRGILREF